MPIKLLQLWARMTTEDAIRRFLRHTELRLSENTYVSYRSVLWRFADFAPKRLDHLTREHIEHYLSSLQKHSNRTVNQHLIALKSFCRAFSGWYGLTNPVENIKKLSEASPKQRILTDAEVYKILEASKGIEDAYDIVRFLLNTGLRAAELQSIKPSDFAADRRMLHIVGKGKRQRAIPLNKTVQEIVAHNMNFSKSFTKRGSLWDLAEKLCRRAGVQPAGPHSFRHHFADSLRKKGVPIYTISKLLGHASVKQTEIYLHCSEADLEGATDVLDE